MPAPLARTDLKTLAQMDLSGGLHTEMHKGSIPINASPEMSNVLWTDGWLHTRPGLKDVPQTGLSGTPAADQVAVTHHSKYDLIDSGGVTNPREFIFFRSIGISGTSSIYMSSGGAFTDQAIGLPTDVRNPKAYSVIFREQLFFTPFFSKELLVYDVNTGWAFLDVLQPNAALRPGVGPRFVTATPSRLFLAGFRSATKTVAWSDFENPLVWNGPTDDAGSSGSQELKDADSPITGMVALGTTVFVFTKNSMYIGSPGTAPNYYIFEKVYHNVGCAADATIKHWQNGVFVWLGRDDVYMGRLGQEPRPIATSLRRYLRESIIGGFNMAGATFAPEAVLDQDRSLYHLFIQKESNTYIFTCNLNTLSWFGGVTAHRVTRVSHDLFRASQQEHKIYIATSEQGQAGTPYDFFEFDFATKSDNSVPFDCSYESKVFHFLELTGNRAQQGDIQKARVISDEDGQVDITIRGGNNWERLTEKTYGTQVCTTDTGNLTSVYVDTKKQDEYTQIVISETSDNFPRIAGYQLSFREAGDTGRKA